MGRPVLVLPEQTQADLRRLSGMDDPQILNRYLHLLADAGWGYQPAATALGLHRQTVRQRAQQGLVDVAGLPPVPEVPQAPTVPQRPALTEQETQRLRALNVLAQQLRPEHPENDPRRLASEELSALINTLTQRKITYQQIGEVLGVAKMTVRARLKRHGYRTVNPALRPYQGHRPATKESA